MRFLFTIIVTVVAWGAVALAQTTAPATRPAALPGSAGPIDVYLIGGQSNATGQGYMANLPAGVVPDQRVLLFNSGRPHLNSGAEPFTWIPLRQASESPDRFGPELGFGNRIQQLQPNKKIAIIKHAHSGTNLHTQWNPADDVQTLPAGSQYRIFVETVEAGLKGLREMGYTPTIRGMLWQQGENDRNGDAAANYGKNLANFIAHVRKQFNAPDMLFVYGYVLPPPNSGEGRDLVRKGEHDVDQDSGSPIAVKGAFVVETDDLDHRATDPNTRYPEDHLHFGTKGTYELGVRMADKMNAKLASATTQPR